MNIWYCQNTCEKEPTCNVKGIIEIKTQGTFYIRDRRKVLEDWKTKPIQKSAQKNKTKKTTKHGWRKDIYQTPEF